MWGELGVVLYMFVGMATALYIERYHGHEFILRQYQMPRSSAARVTCELILTWPKVWFVLGREKAREWYQATRWE